MYQQWVYSQSDAEQTTKTRREHHVGRDAHCGDLHRGTVWARFIAPTSTSEAMSSSGMIECKPGKRTLPFPAAQTRRNRLCGRSAHLDKVYDVHMILSLDITNFTDRLISYIANITITE
jgi:hypothetical protein